MLRPLIRISEGIRFRELGAGTLRLLMSHYTLCALKILPRPPISLIGTLEGVEPMRRGTELEVGALVENISGLNRRTITCTPCPPRSHSSGAICPQIPRAPNTMPRPPISSIGRS